MSFNSSLLQDAEVTTAMSQILSTSPIYSNVVKQLQLSFLNRAKPSESMGTEEDFTALLDSYRLGLILGRFLQIRVSMLAMAPLNRAVLGIDHDKLNTILHKRRQDKAPRKLALDLSHAAFNKYQRLHEFQTHPAQFSAGVFVCTPNSRELRVGTDWCYSAKTCAISLWI